MASVAALRDYGSSDDDSGSGEDSHRNPINTTELVNQKLVVSVVAAPDVLPNASFTFSNLVSIGKLLKFVLQEELDPLRHVDPTSKELLYNPKAEELYAPTLGPDCPFKTGQQRAHRNTVAGFVEPAHLSEFQFEAQRKTFTSFGLYIFCFFCGGF